MLSSLSIFAILRLVEPHAELLPAAPPTGIHQATYDSYIEEAALLYDVDPLLIRAVIWTESRFVASARSRAGAVGLLQLMPRTARSLGVTDRKCPRQSILGGTKYLRSLLDYFGNDLTLALAAYNSGPGTVIKHKRRVPPHRETRRYVKVVKRRLAALEALHRSAP